MINVYYYKLLDHSNNKAFIKGLSSFIIEPVLNKVVECKFGHCHYSASVHNNVLDLNIHVQFGYVIAAAPPHPSTSRL